MCYAGLLVALPCLARVSAFSYVDHAHAVIEGVAAAEALIEECQAKDAAHADAGGNPLELVHDSRPVFRQYLSALRHLLGFFSWRLGSGQSLDAFLARAGELDEELSQMVSLGQSEPYYWWFGPKRHVRAKFEELFSTTVDGRSVREHLASPPSSIEPPDLLLPDIGMSFPRAPTALSFATGSTDFPHAAVRVDMIDEADVCALSAAAARAELHHLVFEKAQHLKPCLTKHRITLDVRTDFESETAQGMGIARYLEGKVKMALENLHRNSLDELVLPVTVWGMQPVSDALTRLISSGQLKGIALGGKATPKRMTKLFEIKGSLRPVFWYVAVDADNPPASVLLETAHKYHIPVLAYSTPVSKDAVFDYVSKQENLTHDVLLVRWQAELGLSVALPSSSAFEDVMAKAIASAPLSRNAWRSLSGLPAFTRTKSTALLLDYEDSFEVKKVLAAAADGAKSALSANSPTQTGSLSASQWADLPAQRQEFADSNYFLYKKDFFTEDVFGKIQAEIQRLWRSSTDFEPNCNMDGIDRLGGYVLDVDGKSSMLYEYFYENEELRQWVSQVNGHLMFPSDFPIELREYTQGSKGMPCHSDLKMYKNTTLDIEVLFTVENFGDCTSSYIARNGTNVSDVMTANSFVIVRPESAYHCVQKTPGTGHRTVLKMIYVGDFHKAHGFWYHAQNVCGDTFNVRAMKARRVKPGAETLEGQAEL